MNIEKLIIDLSKNYNLKYHVYNSSFDMKLPTSVRLEMTLDNYVFKSWGVSNNEDLAFFKALMELIERVSITSNCGYRFKKASFISFTKSLPQIEKKFGVSAALLIPDNSNGVGVGVNIRQAQRSAFLELIERHTILSALYLNISPVKFNFSKESSRIPTNHNLEYFYWKIGNYFIVVAADCILNSGYLFTYACSSNLNKAAEKAYEELIPNIIYHENYSEFKPRINSIIPNDIMSFNFYWKYSGDERMINFLRRGNDSIKFNKIPILRNIFFTEITIPNYFNKINYPLKCIRAISPEAQQLFFDNWDAKYINPLILGKGDLPKFPHLIS